MNAIKLVIFDTETCDLLMLDFQAGDLDVSIMVDIFLIGDLNYRFQFIDEIVSLLDLRLVVFYL